MSDFDPFDRRLVAALQAYAVDAPTVDDPAGFARTIAIAHPRRAGLGAVLARLSGRGTALVLLGLLILASLVAILSVGRRSPIEPPLPMPDELFGMYRADVQVTGAPVRAGTYTLDLNSATLLRGPDDEPVVWAGVAQAIEPTPSGGLELRVTSTSACGDARYALDLQTAAPGASPAPSASGGDPTPEPGKTVLDRLGDGAPFVLLPRSEPCTDRQRILTSGPWTHPSIEVVAGERYDSLDFTEPFSFVMPPSQAALRPSERPWGKGMLSLGEGYDWRGFFIDDVPVAIDPCQPDRGRLADIPGTPSEVVEWLRASPELRVGAPVEILIDGRTALAIPIEALVCHDVEPPLSPRQFYLGSRVYAIPTDDDLILFTASSYGLPEFEDVMDELVRSISFEPAAPTP
jgi:hypothetical protein